MRTKLSLTTPTHLESRSKPRLQLPLITECGFPGGENWRAIVRDGRAQWRRIQTRVAVRDSPATAVAQLESMGYVVTPPADDEPSERAEKLTSW
jgi:hypothetical protein